MRIFSPQLGLNPDSSSGGEMFDVEFLVGLAKRGHQVDVLLRRGQKAPKEKNLNIHYLPFNINTVAYSLCFVPWVFQVNGVKKIIRKSDIFRVHSPYMVGLGAVIYKELIKGSPPIWFHYHHIEKRMKMKAFDKFLPEHADGITAVTKDTLLDLEKICPGIKGKPSEIIMNGIDVDSFRPEKADTKLKELLGIKKNEKIVLFIGHLIPRKGVDILLESWKNVREEFKNVHLILIGRGYGGESLEGLVNDYKETDSKIHNIPYVPNKNDLAKYYNISDVFALPTRLEGFGRTAAEAMSCGVPVVTTNAKGIKDVVLDGETGYQVNIDNVMQFSEKLKKLLSNDSLRLKMGLNARKRVEKEFTWEASLNRAELFMDRLKLGK